MSYLENLKNLNNLLLEEMPEYKNSALEFGENEDDQFNLFRSLSNVRLPSNASKEILDLEEKVLEEKKLRDGIINVNTLEPVQKNDKIYLWQGDITRLNSDAIVNAANSQMLGCFIPQHNCIDNIIHTKAGIELRNECSEIMQMQGFEEPVGSAKITNAYHLPSKYIIHTVGPQVGYQLTKRDIKDLENSYKSILKLADEFTLESIAFCCISTGVFRFPNDIAANIAVKTVENFLKENPNTSLKKIIFNVFKDEDFKLYEELLN